MDDLGQTRPRVVHGRKRRGLILQTCRSESFGRPRAPWTRGRGSSTESSTGLFGSSSRGRANDGLSDVFSRPSWRLRSAERVTPTILTLDARSRVEDRALRPGPGASNARYAPQGRAADCIGEEGPGQHERQRQPCIATASRTIGALCCQDDCYLSCRCIPGRPPLHRQGGRQGRAPCAPMRSAGGRRSACPLLHSLSTTAARHALAG